MNLARSLLKKQLVRLFNSKAISEAGYQFSQWTDKVEMAILVVIRKL